MASFLRPVQVAEAVLVNKVTAFMGLKGKGMPVCTILRGKVMAKEGKLCGDMGYGELVKRIK